MGLRLDVHTTDRDVISDVLNTVRIRSTVWCRSAMRAPWGFRIPARDLAAFHLVASGECLLETERADRLRLVAGDLVIVPNGRAHAARSDPEAHAEVLSDILATHAPENGLLRYGGAGPLTELLCGGFEVDDPAARRLIAELPPILLVRGGDEDTAPEIRSTIDLVLAELDQARPGVDAVVAKLTDVVLALAIRSTLQKQDRSSSPIGVAWRDPHVASVIRAIAARPEHPWTLREMASVAGLSRSAFADRFRGAMGDSPMRYLTRARLGRAAQLLRDPSVTIEQVAAGTGYESDVTLSRAFKRQFGMAPGAYRRNGAVAGVRD